MHVNCIYDVYSNDYSASLLAITIYCATLFLTIMYCAGLLLTTMYCAMLQIKLLLAKVVLS